MKWLWIVPAVLVMSCMVSCANRDGYYNSVKEQNMLLQLKADQTQRQRDQDRVDIKIARLAYQDRMSVLVSQMAIAVANTPNKVDDVVVPLMFSLMLDKFQIANMLAESNQEPIQQTQLHAIEAPEKTGDIIAKSAGVILGVVGLGVNVWNNDIHAKTLQTAFNAAGNRYTLSGENNKMNVDSFKSGSNNVVSAGGDAAITGGDTVEGCGDDCEDGEESEMCTGSRGTIPVKDLPEGCSCGSWQSYDC